MSDIQRFNKASQQLEALIQPRPDRENMPRIALVTAEILEVMRLMPLGSWGLGELSENLTLMIDLCRTIEQGHADMPTTWQEKTKLPRGSFFTEYPVYAALNHVSNHTGYSFARVVLAAHVILSVYAGRPGHTNTDHSKPIPDTNVVAACRGIRLLQDETLDRYGDIPYDRDAVYTGLDAFMTSRPTGISQVELKRFRPIRRIIGLAKGIEHPEKHSKGASPDFS